MSADLCLTLGIIAAIIITIVLYVLLLPKSKEAKVANNRFLKGLRDFLLFKKLYIEAVLRFLYVLITVGCVVVGFFLLFGVVGYGYYHVSTAPYGLAILILGPIVTRLSFELSMLAIILVQNVISINNKLGGEGSRVELANTDSFGNKFSEVASGMAEKARTGAVDAAAKVRDGAERAAAQAQQMKEAKQAGADAPTGADAPVAGAPADEADKTEL